MIVFFRADLSSEIGTGHAMRCLSLSKELKKKGIVSKFIFRDYKDGTRSLIEKMFPNSFFINSDSKRKKNIKNGEYRWSSDTKIDDAKKTSKILRNFDVDWLVVDHYSIDKKWENLVKKSVKNILVIDDLFDRDHDCDALTDPSMSLVTKNIYKKRLGKHADLLLGKKFALIDPIYLKYREKCRERDFVNPRILIFFGGIDNKDYTYKTVEYISKSDLKFKSIYVIVGRNYDNIKNLRILCKKYGHKLVVQTKKMYEFIGKCDIAIGSGGTHTWERCCLGLPTFVHSIAKNQENLIRLASKESLLFSPNKETDYIKFLDTHLKSFIKNKSLLKFISKKSFSSIDGKGCSRISNYMIQKSLVARFANFKDSKKIFNWRNSKVVRNFSRDKNIIKIDEHNKWMKEVLTSKNESLIIVQKKQDPVGVVRFTIRSNKNAEVSIYLVPKYIGKGLGKGVLDRAEELFKTKHKNIKYISANVLAENERSKYLFLNNNYKYDNLWFSKKIN